MANSSAKKRVKDNMIFFRNFYLTAGIPWLLFLLVRVFFYWDSVNFGTWVSMFVYAAIDGYMFWMFSGMSEETNMRQEPTPPFLSYHLDVFYVNTAVKVFAIISGWFFLLFLTIPGYVLYMFATGAFSGPTMPEVEEDPKKKAKRERREKKGGKMIPMRK
jgi:hypothetical protein